MNHKINHLIARELARRDLTYRDAAPYFKTSFQTIGRWVKCVVPPSDTAILQMLTSETLWVRQLGYRCLFARYPIMRSKRKDIEPV